MEAAEDEANTTGTNMAAEAEAEAGVRVALAEAGGGTVGALAMAAVILTTALILMRPVQEATMVGRLAT